MSVATELISLALERPEQIGPLLAALGGVVLHYRRTGRIPIGRLPFRAVREIARDLGDQYFGVRRPRGVPGVIVTVSVDELEDALRSRHFESTDLYSYEYAAEVLNLRRPADTHPHPESGAEIPMELHVRAFKTNDDRLLLLAHDEASRVEAWGDHMRETVLSWSRGQEQLLSTLDELGISAEAVESERDAEIEVVGN